MPGTFDLSAKIDTMNALVKRLTPLRVLAACAALGAFGAAERGGADRADRADARSQRCGRRSVARLLVCGRGRGRGRKQPAPAGAILALHGCGGLFAGKEGERLGERYLPRPPRA